MELVVRDLALWFGPHIVGTVSGATWSDNTGFGAFQPAEILPSEPALQRVREYIEFSEDWHERLQAEARYSRSEWDTFEDVCRSTLWYTVAKDGGCEQISGPVFFGGDVTWGPRETSDRAMR